MGKGNANGVDHRPWLNKSKVFRGGLGFCCFPGFFLKRNDSVTVAWSSLLPRWTSQASHPVGAVRDGEAAPDPVRTTGASGNLTEGGGGTVKGNEAGRTKKKRGGGCIFWSKGVVCSRWQLIPHAGGRLSRQADQKVKAPGGPPFEMGMGPRYQTENISKLPATEQLHIHGWDWQERRAGRMDSASAFRRGLMHALDTD